MPHSYSRWIAVVSIVLALCGVAEAQTTTTIIADTFSGADGTSLAAHTPDINVPNAIWVHH